MGRMIQRFFSPFQRRRMLRDWKDKGNRRRDAALSHGIIHSGQTVMAESDQDITSLSATSFNALLPTTADQHLTATTTRNPLEIYLCLIFRCKSHRGDFVHKHDISFVQTRLKIFLKIASHLNINRLPKRNAIRPLLSGGTMNAPRAG